MNLKKGMLEDMNAESRHRESMMSISINSYNSKSSEEGQQRSRVIKPLYNKKGKPNIVEVPETPHESPAK